MISFKLFILGQQLSRTPATKTTTTAAGREGRGGGGAFPASSSSSSTAATATRSYVELLEVRLLLEKKVGKIIKKN
jgi:hypothetical protein